MLQISQIEKPRCSARMDQKRLRLAMNFPFDSQNCSSSGFQSEIQVDRGSAIGRPPDKKVTLPCVRQRHCMSEGRPAAGRRWWIRKQQKCHTICGAEVSN